jgi:hypothetical protein
LGGVVAHRGHPLGVAVGGKLNVRVPGEVLDILQACPSPEQYAEAALPILTPPNPS